MSDAPSRTLFGTDGIRGVANQHPMTAEVALRLGRAVADHFRTGQRQPRIVIGKDTRLSGYMIESALEAGIVSAGADVLLVGPLPTPAIAFVTWSMRADAGVVISASHNTYQDNGIKLFAADGFKLPDSAEADIERRLQAGQGAGAAGALDIGKAARVDDAEGRYVQYLKGTVPKPLHLDGVRLVVDGAHGAGYRAAPMVFAELGADVHSIAVEPNGRNINDGCGALHPGRAGAEVVRTGADAGVALDGDADRVLLLDERGQVVDGDFIMAILAARMLDAGRLPERTTVGTVMSNVGLERALAAKGGKLLRAAVGDRYVVAAMRDRGLTFGGEPSGHLVFLDHATTGDGILAALQVVSVMVLENRPLSALAAEAMTRLPQVLVNLNVARKPPLDDLPAVKSAIAAAESALGREGRVIVRYSGTEAKARVMIEGADEGVVRAHADEIARVLRESLAG